MEEFEKTKDVETLLGDPKKAILAMAIPTIVALVAQSANNLVDAAWVAGLGTDALAAVGIVFPLFFIIIGICNGIGIGAASAIAKRIGAGDKLEADRTATHAVMLILIASAITMVVLLVLLRPLLGFMGAGASESTIEECVNYALPIIVFVVVFMLIGVLGNILRSEGAAKRSMYILILSAVINLVLDPFFIYDYGLGWGMMGAAVATVISVAIALVVILYWYFIKKDLFLKFRFKGFRFEMPIIRDIFKVGIPAALQMMVISFVVVFMNLILLQAGGDDGVAIYSSDWRILSVLMIPLFGIASGLVPVCAAAYGARRYDKVKIAFTYAVRISTLFMIVVTAITVILAPHILMIFTYDPEMEYLRPGMAEFLRIGAIFLPFVAMGAAAESLFQALGMGMRALVSTVFRNFLLIPVSYIAMLTTSGLTYIWWGSAFAEIAGSLFVAVWGFFILKVLMKEFELEKKLAGT
ncbi:MAG: MATE family efflux transporter [Candidatus Methanoplasma sp.]|nr:MATE family efflux transporter [Candidatus Methanoplasma sp.]